MGMQVVEFGLGYLHTCFPVCNLSNKNGSTKYWGTFIEMNTHTHTHTWDPITEMKAAATSTVCLCCVCLRLDSDTHRGWDRGWTLEAGSVCVCV